LVRSQPRICPPYSYKYITQDNCLHTRLIPAPRIYRVFLEERDRYRRVCRNLSRHLPRTSICSQSVKPNSAIRERHCISRRIIRNVGNATHIHTVPSSQNGTNTTKKYRVLNTILNDSKHSVRKTRGISYYFNFFLSITYLLAIRIIYLAYKSVSVWP
jgi:hypothetical protein